MRTRAAGHTFRTGCTKSEAESQINATVGPRIETLLTSAGVTLTAGSESIGISRQRFSEKLEPGKSPRVSWLYMLPEPGRVAIAADIAGDDFAVVKLPAASQSATTIDVVARIHQATAGVVARGMEIVGAGHCTRQQGAPLTSEIDAAIAALLELKALAVTAKTEGVVGIRGCEVRS